ncbi:hypothetical protein LSCM1_07894 [Leishmania martiniquensis]|uniref:Uncharacterized protein n=1 Tax=Leishmania martiniquensis TaxID=1580590 RepID=A0A836KR73_9TRYP|nr:hypothetical protein LSCM1_07894 [Leishmania martiniquensis]
MPPKLTSKNIFDVVFDELPADAFIDTGPDSLREELMLEAAGIRDGSGRGTGGHRSAQRNGTYTTSSGSGSGGGGPANYRRCLLPSAFIAETAVAVRSKGCLASAAPEDPTTAAAAEHGECDHSADVLDGEDLDGTASPMLPGAPPPAYATVHGDVAVASSGSAFRRADEEVYGLSANCFAARCQGRHSAQRRRDSGSDVTAAEQGLDLQMDTEDEAVKEAIKYAGGVPDIQPAAEVSTERQQLSCQQPIGGSDSLNLRGTRLAASSAGAEIGPGVSVVGDGAEVSLSCDAAPGGTAARAVTATTTELVVGRAPSAAVCGAPPAESPAGGAVHTGAHGSQKVWTAVGPLPQQPFRVAGAPQGGGGVTAAEQLALMPPSLDRVYTGACVMYRHPKNFGFISPDVGGPDVFFINDSIALSFTRLALRAFYRRSGVAAPPSVAAAYRAGAAKESAVGVGEDGASINGVTTALSKAATAAEASGTVPAPLSSPPPAFPGMEAGVKAAGDRQAGVPTAVLGAEGVLGATPILSTRVEDVGDRISIPPTTAEELAWAETAASLLTRSTAQLLQYQVDQGIGGGLRVGDRVSFVVTRNKAARGGNGRLLRAEFIRGVPEAQLAMPLEQSWFHPLFPGAIGQKASTAHGASSLPPLLPPLSASAERGGSGDGAGASATAPSLVPNASNSSTLTRYTGCVRTYDAEEQRGYIRCDESDGRGCGNTPDVIFYAHSVLWDLTRCPPLKRQVKESMRLAYSVCGTERSGKYIATLITNPNGEPFCEENMTFAENVRSFFMAEAGGAARRRGRGEDGGRVVVGTANGPGAGAEGVGGDRKRTKAAEDELLLLYTEDDYPFV